MRLRSVDQNIYFPALGAALDETSTRTDVRQDGQQQHQQEQQQEFEQQQEPEQQQGQDDQQLDSSSVSVSNNMNMNININNMNTKSDARRETHTLRCKVMPILLRLAGDTDWQVCFSFSSLICLLFGWIGSRVLCPWLRRVPPKKKVYKRKIVGHRL